MKTYFSYSGLLFLTGSLLFMTGCPTGGGGSGSIELTNAPSLDNPVGISISLSKINEKTELEHAALGRIDGFEQIHFNVTTVTIDGFCSFGVTKVVATVNGTSASEVATCSEASTFSWSKSFPSNTPESGTSYEIVLKPAGANGSAFSNLESDKFITKTVIIDDNAPDAISSVAVPSSTQSGSVYTVVDSTSTKTITINGTAPSDAYRVYVDNLSEVSPSISGTSMTFDFNLAIGASQLFNLVVADRAGNTSAVSAVTVSYASELRTDPEFFTALPQSRVVAAEGGADPVVMIGGVSTFGLKTSTSGSGGEVFIEGFVGITTQSE